MINTFASAMSLFNVEQVALLFTTPCAMAVTHVLKIDALDQWCLRKLLGIKWYHHVWNDEVRRTTGQPRLLAIVQARRLLSVRPHCKNARQDRCHSENWRRPPGQCRIWNVRKEGAQWVWGTKSTRSWCFFVTECLNVILDEKINKTAKNTIIKNYGRLNGGGGWGGGQAHPPKYGTAPGSP